MPMIVKGCELPNDDLPRLDRSNDELLKRTRVLFSFTIASAVSVTVRLR